jgi:DNA-binding transcriptional LysR family regulator
MDRYRRISQFWSWLPAFRGVAEYESIHGAAAALATSPSALSRTVKLLEEAVGEELFTRDKQSLALTPLGARLLHVVRDAMRAVDDCVVQGREPHGDALTVGATSQLAASLVDVVLLDWALDSSPPVHTKALSEDDVEAALLRGDVDLVIASAATTPGPLEVRAQGSLCLGVYAGVTHPLHSRSQAPGAVDTSRERMVATADGSTGARGVASTVGSLASALLVCEKSTALAVLPDVFAAAFGALRVSRLRDAESHLPLVVLARSRLDGQKTPALDVLAASIAARLAPQGPAAKG